ncbi:hypothetical protein KKF91_15005 [Myxococcota bacterium]|nr:hypothetical protein [Myxococcota bacterium]
MRAWFLMLALAFAGCEEGAATTPRDAATQERDVALDVMSPDSGPPDSGPPDSGPPDSGQSDAAPPDFGQRDAAQPDSGPPDSGPPDSGPPDSGPPCAPVAVVDERGWTHDGWAWEKLGPLALEVEGDALAPSVIPWGAGLRIYFTRQEGAAQSLWTATSEDGLAWTAPRPLEGVEGSYPSAVALPLGGVRLYFGSGFIERADSEDGVRFGPPSTLLMPSAIPGALSLIYPHALERGEALWLYFTYFDGQTFRIGRAAGPLSGEGMIISAPTLEAGAPYANRAVGQARVHAYGAGFWMWLGAYDTSLTDPGPWRIASARSDDGLSWSPVGLSVPLGEGEAPDAWSARDPSVIAWRGALWMFYAGLSPTRRLRLLAARAACPDQPQLFE